MKYTSPPLKLDEDDDDWINSEVPWTECWVCGEWVSDNFDIDDDIIYLEITDVPQPERDGWFLIVDWSTGRANWRRPTW